jgi:hypothetical protein
LLVEWVVMRKFLIPLMAATMLVPATAQAEEDGVVRAMRDRVERSTQIDDDADNRRSDAERPERSNRDRPARIERAPREERAPRVERVQRVDHVDDSNDGGQDADRTRAIRRAERIRRDHRDAQPVDQAEVNEPAQSTQPTERRRNGLAGGFTGIGRDMADGRRDDRGHRDNDPDWRRDRDGDRDWRRDRDGRHRWDRDWRRDRRYDWSNYRNRYRSIFRLGRYYDPYGWGYRRFSIGFSLWPSYYGSSFWLNDPWQYRLPPAYGPYRWVRYFDDALLVDIYTGRVVDVIHNVFW